MKKILKFEVETGPTPTCDRCPFAVRVWDDHWGEYNITCNKAPFLFECGEVNLTTLKIYKEENEN